MIDAWIVLLALLAPCLRSSLLTQAESVERPRLVWRDEFNDEVIDSCRELPSWA